MATNYYIKPQDSWVQVAGDGTTAYGFITISSYPHTHPFYVYADSSVAPTATTTGVLVTTGHIIINAIENDTNLYWVRVVNPVSGSLKGDGSLRIDVLGLAAGSGGVTPVSVTPTVGWDGTTGSGFTSSGAPTASGTPHGSGLDSFQTTGATTLQMEAEYIETNETAMFHGYVPADMVNGALDHVDIYCESGTSFTTCSELSWSSRFMCFGFQFKFSVLTQNGLAQCYARFVPKNGLERVMPFTIWFNDPSKTGYVTRPVLYVDYNNVSAADTTMNGTSSAPFKTVGYATGAAQGSNEGAYIKLRTGIQIYDDSSTWATNPSTTFPCQIQPDDGLTIDDVQIQNVGGVRNQGVIKWHGDKMVFSNIYMNMDYFMFINGTYTMWVMRNCKFWDDSPNINGPSETYGSFTVDSCYYIPPNNLQNEMVASSSNNPSDSATYTAAIDCDIRHPVPTGFRHIVNTTAQATWDVLYHQISHGYDVNYLSVWNYQPQQLTWFKQRFSANPYFVISSTPTYSSSTGLTTFAVTFNGTNDNYGAQDVGIQILTGAHAGEYNQTYGVLATNNEVDSSGNVQILGDYHTMAIGDHLKIFSLSHADAFQIVSNVNPDTYPDFAVIDNLYLQNYNAVGADIQVIFPQCSINQIASGTMTSIGTALTFTTAQDLRVGSFITLNQSPYDNYARIVGVTNSTHFTMDQAFQSGDVTAVSGWGMVPINGASMVNCSIRKTGTNGEEGQWNGAANGYGQLGCTFLCHPDTDGAPRCYVFRVRNSGVRGWYSKGSIYGSMYMGDGGFDLPVADMSGGNNQFIDNTDLPYTGSGSIGAVTFNTNGQVTEMTLQSVDSGFAVAAPWDRNGNLRRVGDPIGPDARIST